jgi:predicted RNase H-like HicB family nuclease
MKTYTFNIVVEPDEDSWRAYCPVLEPQGASTWGDTREEAVKHIEEVVKMVVENLIEHGEPVPEGPSDQVQVSVKSRVAVTV